MIDTEILDQVLPIPDIDDLKQEVVTELDDAGFVITNFHSGGVWNTLLMIVLRIQIEFIGLLRTVLNNTFVAHAGGAWLDIKAADYGKKRKKAQKTQGVVTVSRPSDGEAVKIAKGHVFKTEKDINGDELRFFTTESAVLQQGKTSVTIPIEAESEGARYNVPVGQITKTLTHIGGGVNSITNGTGWLTREGSDTEDDEALRTRCMRSWSELSARSIHDTYMNAAEAVPGVLYVTVDDHHPRGQGTIDVIITSTAGAASESLIADVKAACDAIKAPDDNVLVKSSTIVKQAITLTVTVPSTMSDEGLSDRIETAITDMLRISKTRTLNELTHADIIYKVKHDVAVVQNVKVTVPAADVSLESDKVIMPDTITVNIQGV